MEVGRGPILVSDGSLILREMVRWDLPCLDLRATMTFDRRAGGGRAALPLLMSVLCLLPGCDQGADRERMEAKATIFVDAPEVGVERVGSIGATEGPEESTFGRIVSIAVEETGRLFVLDALAREIRVFERDGQFLRRIGRQGEGPGELSSPLWMDFSGERLIVLDHAGKLVTFDLDGELVAERRLPEVAFKRVVSASSVDGEGLVGVTAASTSSREPQAEIAVVLLTEGNTADTVAIG